MNLLRYVVLLAIGLNLSVLQAQPQRQEDLVGLPLFNARVVRTIVPDTGLPVVRVYTQVQNDRLTFLKRDNQFAAHVQLEVYLANSQQEFVFNRTISKDIIAASYKETNSRALANTLFTDIAADPGSYKATISLLDLNSGKQFTRILEFDMHAFRDQEPVRIGDILFFSEHQSDSAGRITSFAPVLNNAFANSEDIVYAYFCSYNPADQPFGVDYVVRDGAGLPVLQNSYRAEGDVYQEHFLKLNRYMLSENRYQVELTVSSGDTLLRHSAPLHFFWRFVPDSQEDLDTALEQMRYIANTDSIKRYRNASYEDKKAYFERFWRQQDPNPSTDNNELLEEYYRRINHSVERFSATGVSGWFTDRGRIYVKFGQPDDIERHPFAADSYPYQVWRYYSLRKTFLFVDKNGFGDYVLHPSYTHIEFEN